MGFLKILVIVVSDVAITMQLSFETWLKRTNHFPDSYFMRVTDTQKSFWDDHSYLVFPGLFANQASNLSKWVDEISQWKADNTPWLTFFEMDAPDQLSRIENFVPSHKGLGDVLNGKCILDIVSQLMGEPGILYKDRINFKLPGGGAHAAHQDGVAYDQSGQEQFDSNAKPYLSVLISVDASTDENGVFEVANNWKHDSLEILSMESPRPDHPSFTKIAKSVEDELDWVKIYTQPGDAVIFTERIPHRSESNRSNTRRRILYGVYNPISFGDRRGTYFAAKREAPNDARYMVGNPHARVGKTK